MKCILAPLISCAVSCSLQASGQVSNAAGITSGYPNRFEVVEVEGGATLPLGNLKRMMHTAPTLGVWYRTAQNHRCVLSYGGRVSFPGSHGFSYKGQDLQSQTKNLSGMIGVKLTKRYPISAKRFTDLEWTSLLGYGFYLYDDIVARDEYRQWPDWKKEKEGKPIFVKPFSTAYFGQGVGLRIRDFGISASYGYAPYGLFSQVIDRDFGAHHISVGIFYRQ